MAEGIQEEAILRIYTEQFIKLPEQRNVPGMLLKSIRFGTS